jgi:DUF971 family protein
VSRDEPPLALRLDAGQSLLEVQWSDGSASLTAEHLRANCPCAHCELQRRKGLEVESHGVAVVSIEAYGPNAVRLAFNDGHSRGIYPFAYLRTLDASQRASH